MGRGGARRKRNLVVGQGPQRREREGLRGAGPRDDGLRVEDFEASSMFAGARPGWAFRGGDRGTGYYRDRTE